MRKFSLQCFWNHSQVSKEWDRRMNTSSQLCHNSTVSTDCGDTPKVLLSMGRAPSRRLQLPRLPCASQRSRTSGAHLVCPACGREGVPVLGTAGAVCLLTGRAPGPAAWHLPSWSTVLGPLSRQDPTCQKQRMSSFITHLGLVCGSRRRERPKPFGNVGDPGKGGRELSEVHVSQGWGCVQAVPAVQLWEKQTQTASVSGPRPPKMCLMGKKNSEKMVLWMIFLLKVLFVRIERKEPH